MKLQLPDAKRLLGNFMWLGMLQVANLLFPLVTLPYLARVIGAEGFGKIAFATAVVLWLQTICDWGFNYTATRDIAKNRENPGKVSDIFSDVLWSRLALMLVCYLLLGLLLIAVPAFRGYREVLTVTALMLPGHILFPEWYFQAIERMKFITLINVAVKTLFVAAVFLFINRPEDYLLQPLFISLGYLVSGIIAMTVIYRLGVRIRRPNIVKIKETLKGGGNIFINELMPNCYNSMSVVLLGVFGGSVSTGLLDAAMKFVKVARQILDTVSRTFFPFLARKMEYHSYFAKVNLMLSLIFAILLYMLAPTIISIFFTLEFEGSVPLLRILAVSLPFLAMRNVYGTNGLILAGRDREFRDITIITSLLGLAAAIPLVYYYGPIGAALTLLLTRLLAALLLLTTHRRPQPAPTTA